MVTNFVSSMNFNSIVYSSLFPKNEFSVSFLKKNQEPNNLVNQKDKYIVRSTDIQKIDEIHSREKFKDFVSLDFRTLPILVPIYIILFWIIYQCCSEIFFKLLSEVDKSLLKNLLKRRVHIYSWKKNMASYLVHNDFETHWAKYTRLTHSVKFR